MRGDTFKVMADFCGQCSLLVWGAFMPNVKSSKPHWVRSILCEGCGKNCLVDYLGYCTSMDCDMKHGALKPTGLAV